MTLINFRQFQIVTLCHNDIPQWVQDEGGFLNSNIVQYFKLYADTIFKEFGSRVKIWITFNEPFDACLEGYGTGLILASSLFYVLNFKF